MKKLLTYLTLLCSLFSADVFCSKKSNFAFQGDQINEKIKDSKQLFKTMEKTFSKHQKKGRLIDESPEELSKYIYQEGFSTKTAQDIAKSMTFLANDSTKKGLISVFDLREEIINEIAPTIINNMLKKWRQKTVFAHINKKSEQTKFETEYDIYAQGSLGKKEYVNHDMALELIFTGIAFFLYSYLTADEDNDSQSTIIITKKNNV